MHQRFRFGQNQLEILVLFLKLTDNSSAFPNSCTVSPSRWGARNGTCPLPIRVVQCSGGSEQLWTSANLTASAAGDLQLAIRYGYVRTTVVGRRHQQYTEFPGSHCVTAAVGFLGLDNFA